jgi:serine/threonine-protein kinase RsbW
MRRPLVVPMRTSIFPAKFDQLEAIRQFAGQAARDMGMDDSDAYTVELAVDEACTNIIEHAYRGIKGGDIECTCDAKEDNLTIMLRDHGSSFNPASVSTPDLGTDLENRKVGGLGIYLIRKLMDEVHFEPLGESGNLLIMVKRRKQA